MLADVLWEAANVFLFPPSFDDASPHQWSPSCCAVMQAISPRWASRQEGLHKLAKKMPAFKFLAQLGCDTHNFAMRDQKDPQGARYMWLLLAMHVAEDEGIEIEVSP